MRLAAVRSCRGQGLSAVLSAAALTDESLLRAHYAELVSPRIGKDSPGLSAGLPDVDSARPERKKAVNFLIAVRGTRGMTWLRPRTTPPGLTHQSPCPSFQDSWLG